MEALYAAHHFDLQWMKVVVTRTTRTPAFWGYPPPPNDYPYHWVILENEDTPRRLMITHTIESYWIPSQKKTKSKLQILKISQNFKFQNFETGITRDTPSEVAW